MKILLITKWIDGGVKGKFHHSGEWIDTFELACAFSNLEHQVSILSPKPLPIHKKNFYLEFGKILESKKINHYFANCQVAVGRYEGSTMLRMDLATIRAVREFKPDIVQYMQFTNSIAPILIKQAIFFFGVILPKDYSGKDDDTRLRINKLSPIKFSPLIYLENLLYKFLLKLLKKENYYRNTKLIAKHKKALNILKKNGVKNVCFIHKGVEYQKYSERKKIDNQTILFMGQLSKRKGITDLLEIFVKISDKFPKAKLLIAGTGSSEFLNSLKKKSTKLKNRILFTGPVNYQNKGRIFGRASIFCLPSYADASPAVIMEAMAAGLAIVTTYQSDPPIKNEAEGILVQAGEVDKISSALERLLLNSKLKLKLGNSARKMAKNYDWEKKAEEFIKLFQLEMDRLNT